VIGITRAGELAGGRKPQRLKLRVSAIAVRREWNSYPSRLCDTERYQDREPSIGGGRAGEQQVLRLRLTIRFAHRQTVQDDRVWGGERPRYALAGQPRRLLLHDWLINAEAGEGVFQLGGIDEQAAAGGFYVFEFVEGAEEAELGGGVLFGVAEGALVGGAPGGDG
jgi:hypothetical protein